MLTWSSAPGVTVTVGTAGSVITWIDGSASQSPARPREFQARTRETGLGPPTRFWSVAVVAPVRDAMPFTSISYSTIVTPAPPASAGGLHESVTEPVPHGTAVGPAVSPGDTGAVGWLHVSPTSVPHADVPALLSARTDTW